VPSKRERQVNHAAFEEASLPDFLPPPEPDIATEIRSLIPELRGQLLQAAAVILENPANVALLSMRSMATAIGVPPVTMVRLAQRLGLSGYNALRQPYVDLMKSSAGRNLKQARNIATHARTRGTDGFITTFFEAEQQVLGQTLASLSVPSLQSAVERLARGRHVYITARRSTYPVAWGLAYSLRKIRPGIKLLGSGNEGPETDLFDCEPDDVLVAISFAPYSRLTKVAADKASKAGATVIAVTDRLSAPIAKVANHTFVTNVSSESFPESMIGPSALVNLMVALVVSDLGNAALDRISATDHDIIENGEFVGTFRGNNRDAKVARHNTSSRRTG